MFINGSGGTPTVQVGSEEQIDVAGSTQCLSDAYVWTETGWAPYAEGSGAGQVEHYFDFEGNGNWSWGGQSFNVDTTTYYIHSEPGLYTVVTDIQCSCYPYGMSWDWVGAARNVNVCDASEFETNKNRFQGPRTSVIQRYQMQDQGNVFSFHMNVFSDDVSASEIAASFVYWNDVENTPSCGAYDVTATSQYLTSRSPGNDVIFERLPGLSGCGNFNPTDPNVEVLSVPETPAGSCGPIPEIFAHEIGHALGFPNSLNTDSTDIMNSPRGAPRKVKDYHAQTLLHYY
jgi:hypothetical protein